MRILAIVSDIPNPPISGTRARNFHLWPAVRELGHEVRVLGLNGSGFGGSDRNLAVSDNDGEFFRPDRAPLPVRAFFSLIRSHYERARSSLLANRVDELARRWEPDVIHAEELRMGFYLPRFRGYQSGALHSVTLHNVESDLYAELGASEVPFFTRPQHWLQSRSLAGYEARVVSTADLVFSYSPVDFRRYRALYPSGNWRLTKNATDARHMNACPPGDGARLLIVGTLSYSPNVRGLWWMLDEVWPRLKGSFSLTVAGSGAHPQVRERILLDGARFVDSPRDLEPLYRECGISIVPVFEGSGTRGKILEACAYQRLVITTSRGLEGLDLVPGEEGVIVADDPATFAGAIEYWSRADEERCRIAAAGRAAVMKRYDWSMVAGDLVRNWSEYRAAQEIRERGVAQCA